MISFFVPGKPVGKQRPRFGNGKIYTPKQTKDYETLIGNLALQARLKAGKYSPSLKKMYLHIKIHMQKETRCDLDNVLKSIQDGMNKIIYQDDKQIRQGSFCEEINIDNDEGVVVLVGELAELQKLKE